MRKLTCFMILPALLLLIGGCKAAQKTTADLNAPDGDGFYTLAQKATGGNPMENANAKSLTISHENGATVIRIAFVLGSKLSNVDEAAASAVPSYQAFGFASPDRLVLDIDNLAFWDYDRKVDIAPDDALFYGIFKQALTDTSRFRIFFQLKQDVDYKLEEKGDTLTITLREKTQPEQLERYFVTANIALPLGESRLGSEFGLYPTLCDDLSRTLLISQAFETLEEAEAFRADILENPQSSGLLTEKQVEVISLENKLPNYNIDLDFQHVYNFNVIRTGGEERQLPVIMPDGLFLCMAPDGRRMLLSKLLSDPQAENDDAYTDAEQLWIVELSGRKKQLTDFEFSNIEEAAFSPNGKLLAILERSNDASYLHIFDMETNQLLYNLSEEGFGDSTSTFIWDTMGTAIYAVGGTDKVRLLKYDFTIPDESKRVSMVEDKDIEAESLGFLGGELYFTDSVEGVSKVYKIKPEGGVRAPLTGGNSFSISPDGKYMAVQEVSAIGGEGEETTNNASIKIVNMATKAETGILKDANIISMGWGAQNKLYFSVGNLEQADAFQFKLMQYDVESQQMFDIAEMVTTNIYPSIFANNIYLPYWDNVGEARIRATYLLSIE